MPRLVRHRHIQQDQVRVFVKGIDAVLAVNGGRLLRAQHHATHEAGEQHPYTARIDVCLHRSESPLHIPSSGPPYSASNKWNSTLEGSIENCGLSPSGVSSIQIGR